MSATISAVNVSRVLVLLAIKPHPLSFVIDTWVVVDSNTDWGFPLSVIEASVLPVGWWVGIFVVLTEPVSWVSWSASEHTNETLVRAVRIGLMALKGNDRLAFLVVVSADGGGLFPVLVLSDSSSIDVDNGVVVAGKCEVVG